MGKWLNQTLTDICEECSRKAETQVVWENIEKVRSCFLSILSKTYTYWKNSWPAAITAIYLEHKRQKSRYNYATKMLLKKVSSWQEKYFSWIPNEDIGICFIYSFKQEWGRKFMTWEMSGVCSAQAHLSPSLPQPGPPEAFLLSVLLWETMSTSFISTLSQMLFAIS